MTAKDQLVRLLRLQELADDIRRARVVVRDAPGKIEEIEKEWREPEERHFQVRTKDNKLFQLCYNESQDHWSLTDLRS